MHNIDTEIETIVVHFVLASMHSTPSHPLLLHCSFSACVCGCAAGFHFVCSRIGWKNWNVLSIGRIENAKETHSVWCWACMCERDCECKCLVFDALRFVDSWLSVCVFLWKRSDRHPHHCHIAHPARRASTMSYGSIKCIYCYLYWWNETDLIGIPRNAFAKSLTRYTSNGRSYWEEKS